MGMTGVNKLQILLQTQNVKLPTKSSSEMLCFQLIVHPSILMYVVISRTHHKDQE